MGSLGLEAPLKAEASLKEKNRVLFETLPASLPVANFGQNVDHFGIASAAIAQLEQLEESAIDENIVWRDICALTGTFRTFYGAERVLSVWRQLGLVHKPFAFKLALGTSEIVNVGDKHSWIQTAYTFECRGQPETVCSGFMGLIPDSSNPSNWKIWMLTTLLEEIKGFPNPDRITVQPNNIESYPENVLSSGAHDKDFYQCVVVGAGFSGLCVAGRLKALGVQCLNLEKNPQVGDNWKNRYLSARFHTTKQYCDFPHGRTFTDSDPVFPGRLDLIRSYEKYVKTHGLEIWCSSPLKNASYETQSKLWTLTVDKEGKTLTIKANHLVLAIGGVGAVPFMPELRDRELFRGEVLHSFNYKTADQWKGKVGVIIGSANTAHDVAEDMVDAGLSSVTLVQRNATPVFPIEWYKQWMDTYYNDQIPLEFADRRTISLPVAIVRAASVNYFKNHMTQDPEKLDALERAGFSVERSGDMVKCTFGNGAGGHHTDVGGRAKIIAGLIKVKTNASLTGFTPSGLEFADGSRLDADVVVFCTGFCSNMQPEAAKFVGNDIGSRLDDFWGIDDEGELRGAFKRMKQPGIWYTGGGAPWARFGSRFLALQIKADLEGCPLPLYKA